MKPKAYKMPEPKLKEGVIYSGDNGQLICRNCAGSSAKYSGRDLSGHRVSPVKRDENAYWFAEFKEDMQCEGGCISYGDVPRAIEQMNRAQLRKAYVETIGYDPFKDCHTVTNDYVRRILIEYRDADAKERANK
jgi:hypothetical protein